LRHKWILISFVLFAVAGVLLAYPLVSTIINSKYHSDIETAYTAAIEDTDAAELTAQREAAEQYNAMLSGATITEGGASAPPLAYVQQLTVGGAMAYVDIPKINVYLPVQHGTDADTLEKSVGHVVGTSLPVGGSSTHAVLSAHSGLASSKLFSDIDQLAVGDVFYIRVLGDTLVYEVDSIHTVLPTDTSLLQIEDGKDYVTLVTCTPFGVNTHRLLVRGHRIPYTPEQEATAAAEKPAASSWTQHYLIGLGIGLGAVAVVGGAYFLVIRRRMRHA
jgi:sortase A